MKTAPTSFVRNVWIVLLAATLSCLSVPAAVWRVKPAGDDANSGASWDQAKRTVTQALAAATGGDEIWVAAGVYAEHVEMKPDVALYGGFAGGETSRAERDWVRHLTVLDGTTNGIAVLVSGGGPATVVDGFTIRNGLGAGVRLYNTQGVLRHNVIRDNVSSASLAYGAGVSVKNLGGNAVATIDRNVIVYNYAYDGGGISCIDASPRITFNVIAWNFAQQDGGGISCWRDASPLIANNVISANTAFTLDGVAVPLGGGGIFATADDLDGRPHPTAKSSPLILNNVVVGNGGWRGGGICLADSNGGVPQVVNNTIVANNGAGIFWGSSSLPSVALLPVLRNNLVAFNPWGLELAAGTPTNATIEFNCVYGNQVHGTPLDYVGLASRTGVDGNISLNPNLANYLYSEFHLQPDSPCINAGTNLAEASGWLDIDNQPRINNSRIDMGADESADETWTTAAGRFHVRTNGSDTADGLSWATAKKTLQAAVDAAMVRGGEVWAGAGTYAEHLYLPAFVHLYGGFAGTETDRAARDPRLHPTVVDGGEMPNVVNVQNGGYRVCTLDGFTVCRGGRYTGGAGLNKYGRGGSGGGLHINLSSPIIANNLITSNSLAYDNVSPPPGVASYGAGIYCKISYACIVSNVIQDNEILNDFDGSGGAIYCERWSRPLIQGNTLARNHAAYGPAIYSLISMPAIRNNLIESNAFYNTYPFPLYFGSAQGAVTLLQNDDCSIEGNVFRGNTAATGAAIYGGACAAGLIQNNLIQNNHAYDPTAFGGTGGGIYWMVIPGATGTVSILHNTFVGNIASNSFIEQGGGLAFVLTENSNRLVIANNIFASNSSGLYQIPSTPLAPPILERNNLVNIRSNYLNLTPGPTDLSVAPAFVGNGDWRLRTNSPCVDAGIPLTMPAFDQAGIPRPLDGNNDGVAAPDLGAFETLHPQADSDRDQMPDAWELTNALDPVRDDAAADKDQDRVSNRDEYVAGTRPSDLTSVLALLVEFDRLQGGARLEWFGVNNRTYAVESADRLPRPGPWPILTNGVLGKDAKLEFRDSPAPGPERFYRLRVEQVP